MTKKAVIVVSLVKESLECPNGKIEREIFEELSKHPSKIPWMKDLIGVTVKQE